MRAQIAIVRYRIERPGLGYRCDSDPWSYLRYRFRQLLVPTVWRDIMKFRLLAAAALSALMIGSAAFAQTAAPAGSRPRPPPRRPPSRPWRARRPHPHRAPPPPRRRANSRPKRKQRRIARATLWSGSTRKPKFTTWRAPAISAKRSPARSCARRKRMPRSSTPRVLAMKPPPPRVRRRQPPRRRQPRPPRAPPPPPPPPHPRRGNNASAPDWRVMAKRPGNTPWPFLLR